MHISYIFALLIILFVLFVFWLFNESPSDLKVSDLKISKKKFVQLALQWCSANLGTIKHPYQLKIYYYPNKKYSGRFLSTNKMIIIYVYPDLKLIDLVDTILHEFCHHLQFVKVSAQQEYDKKYEKFGYWKNPYEIEARKMGKRHKKECLDWMIRNYF